MRIFSSVIHNISVIGMICLFFTAHVPELSAADQDLDDRVRSFLDKNHHLWCDMNVPESDGKVLYDLILKHGYTKALDIGTSTGCSGIWIAWALSKTGGKLITIEVDERRHQQALANFEEAGLSAYIDARLADAHELVPLLEGPFDFVFCDADKHWYKNYLIAVLPKLTWRPPSTGRAGPGYRSASSGPRSNPFMPEEICKYVFLAGRIFLRFSK
jgi:hypothetical protein